MPKYSNSTSYTGRKANKDHSGQAKFATTTEAVAGDADDVMISPLTLSAAVDDLLPDATTTVKGKVELATGAEMTTGTSETLVPPVKVVKDYVDGVVIAGAPVSSETIAGIGQLATDAEAIARTASTGALALFLTPSNLTPVLAAPGAIGGTTPAAGSFTTISSSGLASLSASATILTAGTALNLGSDNSADAVNLGVGTTARAVNIGSSAAAHVVTIGSTTGAAQVVINAGTAGIQMASTSTGDITLNSADTLLLDCAGVLELNSSAGVIGIGNDAVAQNINVGTGAAARTLTLGNSTGATSIVLNCGTGALNIGTNAVAHTVSIGNSTGATSVVIDSGTGALNLGTNAVAHIVTVGNVTGATAVNINVGTGNFALNGVGASTYAIGAATTTGTIVVGGTAGTGTMTFGSSSGTNIVQIGAGEGATTVSIAGGATSAKAVDIAIGAVANVVRIGSASGAASMELKVGTGNFDLNGAATSTYAVGAATTTGSLTLGGTAQSGTITLGSSSATNIVAICNGSGAGTVNIAAVQVAGAVNIGTAMTSGTCAFGGTGAHTGTISVAPGTGAQTISIADNTGVKTINIAGDAATSANVIKIGSGAGNQTVTIGSTNSTSTLTLQAGSGKVLVTGSHLAIVTAGKGLQIESGAVTDMCGTGVLTAGTQTISNTNIATGDQVYITRVAVGASTALGMFSYTISNGASFTVTAKKPSDATTETGDVSTYAYVIIKPL